MQPSFRNKREFYKKIDALPRGPEWKCEIKELIGDRLDEKKKPITEDVEIWHRDPVECIKELIGNPAFRETLRYAPERVYEDEKGESRQYNEMWTCDWWWDLQVSTTILNRPDTN